MFWYKKREEDISNNSPFTGDLDSDKGQISEKEFIVDERVKKAPQWIEIEGYKAVKFDMSSFQGAETYALGETKKYDFFISPCEKGYHFGKSLKEVISNYQPIYGTRYFKVMGLVPAYSYIDGDNKLRTCPKSCGRMIYEKDLATYVRFNKSTCAERPCSSDYEDYDWKYVAKEITFVEEVPYLSGLD